MSYRQKRNGYDITSFGREGKMNGTDDFFKVIIPAHAGIPSKRVILMLLSI
jgi:hypothetical protein